MYCFGQLLPRLEQFAGLELHPLGAIVGTVANSSCTLMRFDFNTRSLVVALI